MAAKWPETFTSPGSVTWRVQSHPTMFIGGLRALLIQALHPHAMAGVAEHSDYLRKPLYRLLRTAQYVSTLAFGTPDEAQAAAALVNKVHTYINGIDPVTGERYSAEDPATLCWVHCVEVHSFMAAYKHFAAQVSEEDQDRYYRECVRGAEMLGVPANEVPGSRGAMREYFQGMVPKLRMSEPARLTAEFVVNPPSPHWSLVPFKPLYWMISGPAIAITPKNLREIYGLKDRPVMDRFHYAQARALGRINTFGIHRLVGFDNNIRMIRYWLKQMPFAGRVPKVLDRMKDNPGGRHTLEGGPDLQAGSAGSQSTGVSSRLP